MPKPKGKLDSLEDAEHEKLVGWLLGGMTYEKAVAAVNLEFGISTTTRALHEFWDSYCEPRFLERRRGAARLAQAVRKEALDNPTDFDAAAVDRMSELSFLLAEKALNNPNPLEQERLTADVKILFGLVLKKRSQESKEKDLEFEKEKYRTGLLKKTELAMTELHAVIKDNPAALAAFQKMQEAMATK